MLVIWTGKPASIEVVVPVVHRRGGAGKPTGASSGPHALFPAFGRIGINGRVPTRSASVWISAGGERSFAALRRCDGVAL
jgi:hypothetical protein